MKTTRMVEKIGQYLIESYIDDLLSESINDVDLGVRNTEQIKSYINDNMRHGTTSQQLGNVLAKNPKIILKSGFVPRQGIVSGSYDICSWNINLEGYATMFPVKFEKYLTENDLNRRDLIFEEDDLESLID